MSQQGYVEIDESDDGSDADSCRTDDSEQEDPSFDLLEETRSRFSNLSVKRKSASCSRIVKKMNISLEEGEVDGAEVIVPELDEKDQISFEIVQKMIEVGQVEKLKVEQCKVYLRKHGLRLTGNKDILLQRIKEHLSMNGEGEKKYPASSFVMNCKGDACTGDIVMFEQNVYEMFNIASRSATGPPCGTRLVVGRIVKESYGAAKQQHTFTIEVLWSKGMKPLPTLHPLLIKGRNLYRLKTMRQRWEDEGKRQKILFEKHTRGSVARSSREARIQEKEMRKTLRENRVLRLKDQNGNFEENKTRASEAPPHNSGISRRQPNEEQVMKNTDWEQTFQQKKLSPLWKENSWVPPPEALHRVPTVFPGRIEYKENVSSYLSMGLLNNPKSSFGGPIGKQPTNFNTPKSPLRMSFQNQQRTNINYTRSQFQGYDHEGRMSSNRFQSPLQRQNFQESNNGNATFYRFQGQGHEQKQLCRYYPQGRCYYGDRCKYLH